MIQLAMAKGSDLARFGISIADFSNYGLGLLRVLSRWVNGVPGTNQALRGSR
jgi:hypothetical protein